MIFPPGCFEALLVCLQQMKGNARGCDLDSGQPPYLRSLKLPSEKLRPALTFGGSASQTAITPGVVVIILGFVPILKKKSGLLLAFIRFNKISLPQFLKYILRLHMVTKYSHPTWSIVSEGHGPNACFESPEVFGWTQRRGVGPHQGEKLTGIS